MPPLSLKANLRRAYASALAAESLAEHALSLSKSLRTGDFIIRIYFDMPPLFVPRQVQSPFGS